MCRLILMNKKGEKEIEKRYGIQNFLNYLEKSFGGDGNGYALMKNNKVTKIEKGLNLSTKDIARKLKRINYDWCIFHTRYASVGMKSNQNCHPFFRKGKSEEVMAMNGTESSVGFISKVLEKTDTEAILDLKVKYNLELPVLKKLGSIFVGFSKGKPCVVANNTTNIRFLKDGRNNAIVFASEFPDEFTGTIYRPKKCFIWNGEKIDMTNFKKCYPKKYKYNDYYLGAFPNYSFNDYYEDLYQKYYEEGEKDVA